MEWGLGGEIMMQWKIYVSYNVRYERFTEIIALYICAYSKPYYSFNAEKLNQSGQCSLPAYFLPSKF